ncbi:methionine aminopeptidase [Bacillus sp. FJAT-27225]|uniref:methionine aminopeptidase n=1 Tax=Bacillus sp. FJAT-27225 TaxID=1743144 RepID=UPI000982459B|nr:methionine aminopeptidase [Bacillus sp. FJAT-27225]
MGIFNDWRAAQKEKYISKMKGENRCPLCHGRGFIIYPAFDYYHDTYDCVGCNGSGFYSEWENIVE